VASIARGFIQYVEIVCFLFVALPRCAEIEGVAKLKRHNRQEWVQIGSHPEELVRGEVEAGNALLLLERQLLIGAVHSPTPTIVCNVLPGWEEAWFRKIFFAFEADPKSLVLVNLEWLK